MYLGGNLTEAPIDPSNPDNPAVAEEANADEAITAVAKASNEMETYLEEEHNTESYQETSET